MIVIRRTYYCKLNQAGAASGLFREIARISREADPHMRAVRVYTDLSGAANRVVMETERDRFESPRDISRAVHGHPEAPALFSQVSELIERSEVEFLQLEESI